MWLHDYAATLEEDGPFFKEIQELFTTHFGLCVWTGRLRFMPMGDMRHKIAAYLTLPNDTSRHDKWRSEYYQADNIDFGVPVNVGVSPTEQSLSRFSRALKILGIQASCLRRRSIHGHQKSMTTRMWRSRNLPSWYATNWNVTGDIKV